MSISDTDKDGLMFASHFDDEMNDGIDAFSPQSHNSSIIGFATIDRILKFINANSDIYKLVRKTTNEIVVDEYDVENKLSVRLKIKPISLSQIKDHILRTYFSDNKDNEVSPMEVLSIPIKEALDIMDYVLAGDKVTATKLIEELLEQKLEAIREDTEVEVEVLDEKFRIKVNAKGKRRRKVICRKGFKVSPNGRSCVRIKSAEKRNRRLAVRKTRRTKKRKGVSGLRKALRKRKIALRKRHNMGL